MTPKNKAQEVLKDSLFDVQRVLGGFAAKYPNEFLKLAAKYPITTPVNTVVEKPLLTEAQLEERVKYWLRLGRVITAMKEVRAARGSNLKDAKEFVDRFR